MWKNYAYSKKIIETHDAQDDLGNISKVNETCNFIATYDNRLEKQTLFHHQIAIISMQILDRDV